MKNLRILGLVIIIAASFNACRDGSDTAVLWTDRTEFAFYAEYFNAAQDKYKVEVRYFDSPAQKLSEGAEPPDIAAASWLRSAAVKTHFRRLDSLLSKKGGLDRSAFYAQLLALGAIDNRQYLLPVNYNIPAIVFTRESGANHSSPFTIGFDEIKERGKAFNVTARDTFSRIGFSPLSNIEFLFLAATLFGANFHEAAPIAWDPLALDQAVTWIQQWITETNTSIQMEDDFASRFFFEPPENLVNSGHVMYIHMNSSRFFTLPEERRANLDFRWIVANEMIPLAETSVYYGIHRKTKAVKAAEAFTRWFFSAETQRMLLDEKKRMQLNHTSFGIAGGFSAMRTVTEQVFPQFYPGLLGRVPPDNFLAPANILPQNWPAIKEWVILPYLQDRVRLSEQDETRSLERRLIDWYRLNRG